MESTAQVWICDQCKHTWLMGEVVPTHCAKCRSRKWNTGVVSSRGTHSRAGGADNSPETRHLSEGSQSFTPVNMQALRDICAGKIERQLGPPTEAEVYSEIPTCGKQWWEDGEHYECLMDAGHREQKHGMRGMVRRVEG